MSGCSSDDSSELVSHQMALSEASLEPFLLNSPRDLQPGLRGFFPFGTTTVFGPYVNSFFEFTHYAFGGVCATSAIRTLALHFGFGTEQACSAVARVTSSLPISGLPFVLGLFFASLLLRGVSSFRGSPPVGPPLQWSTLPSSLGMCSFLRSSIRDGYIFWGRRTCFPSAVDLTYSHRFQYPPHSCVRVPRSLCVQGQSDVFPDRVRVRGHTHFFVSLPFHCSRVCRSRVAPLCFPFKFSSGVVRRSTCVVRLVSVSQLSWSGQVGRLPSCVQVIGLSQTRGLVVLDVSDSVEFHPRVTQCMS